MIPTRRAFPSRTKAASAALAAAAVLFASAASLSCENALYDKVKRTQEIAASSKIVLAHEGAGIPNGAILDLGKIVVGSGAVSVEIVILNAGADTLEIDTDRISITAADGTETGTFTISSRPEAALANAASGSLVLECAALGLGPKRATVTIPTNDVRYGSFTFTVALTGGNAGKAATPTFTPAGGSVGTDIAVNIDCETAGATIHYTMTTWSSSSASSTPADPTAASTPYDPQAPIAIAGNGTNAMIKAVAVRNGYDDSSIAQTSFLVIYGSTAAQPVFSPLPDTYGSDQYLSITSGTAGASIYYATSSTGTPANPTAASSLYTGPIQVAGDGSVLRIKAVAVAPGVLASAEAGGTYTIAYPRLAFDANGGTGTMEAQAIAEGSGASIRANSLARPGYTFTGWDTEAGGTGTRYADGADYAMGDTGATLYAQWAGKTYAIVFNAQDGTVLQTTLSATNGSTYGASGALPTVTRSGYAFGGWFTAPGGAGSQVAASTTVAILTDETTQQVLYALWTAKSYTVSFDAQGGTCPTASKSVTYASTYGELPVPSRTGCTFGGWWTAAGGGGAQVAPSTAVAITEAQTLYALWTANSYTVSLDAQGGSPSSTTIGVTYGATYGALPTPARDYYGFGGWWTATGGGGTRVTSSTSVSVTDNTTVLYAKWTGNSYTVGFDAQGGSVSPASKTVTYASSYGELPTPSRDYYGFGGWWTGAGGTGSPVTSATTVAVTDDSTVLYAKWTGNQYKVTFDAQQGSCDTVLKYVAYGSAYGELPAPTRTGYTFGGWYTGTSGNGTQIAAATTVSITDAQTLYAKWTVNSYTVTFDSQGGSAPSIASKTVTFAALYGTIANDPTRTGYTFGGWWTGTGGTGSQIYPTEIVAIASDHSLYAKWTGNSYTVTFDAQGGSVSPTSMGATYGSAYGALPTPTRAGFAFIGWWSEAGASGTPVTSTTTVATAAAHTVYAYWGTAGLVYSLINGNTEYSVAAGTATSGSIVIPRYYAGLPVTTIADNGFKNCSGVTALSLPEGFTTLGNSSLYGCSGLTSLALPSSLKMISGLAFNYCSGLTSLAIPNGCYVDGSVFMYCTNLATVTLPNDLAKIPSWLFYDCVKLANITIPATVTRIDEDVFYLCTSLASVTIPSGVTIMGGYIFRSCSALTSVTVQAATPPTAGSSMFLSCGALAHIYVPSASVNAYKAAANWSGYASLISGY